MNKYQAYYDRNRLKILQKQKEYREQHKDQLNKALIAEKQRLYRENNKEFLQMYRKNRQDYYREYARRYRIENKEYLQKYFKEYYQKSKYLKDVVVEFDVSFD